MSPIVGIGEVLWDIYPDGRKVAGGAGLVTGCDLAVAVPGAKFGYPEVRRGLVAAMVMPHLLRHVGERAARWLLLTGELIEGAEAVRIGLINQVAKDDLIIDVAVSRGKLLAEGAGLDEGDPATMLAAVAVGGGTRASECRSAGDRRVPRRPRCLLREETGTVGPGVVFTITAGNAGAKQTRFDEVPMRSIYRLSYPVIVVTVLLTSCSRSGDASKDFAANKELFDAIAKADSLVLYEGLPHQDFEAQLLEQEMRNKQSVTLHGFPFYRETLEVPVEDRDTLKAMLGSESFFRPWRGEKKCGGFHPDYLTEWRHGEEIYQVLVCFGCFEVKVFGAGKSLWCDIGYEEYGKLKSLLTKYRKNRPPQEN